MKKYKEVIQEKEKLHKSHDIQNECHGRTSIKCASCI